MNMLSLGRVMSFEALLLVINLENKGVPADT